MRAGVIQRILSRLLWFTVVSLIVPAIVAIIYWESVWWAFGVPALVAAIGAVVFARLPAARVAPQDNLRRREGFIAVILGWMVLVVFCAVAFQLTGAFPDFHGAFFESMSGFTTTGATVISDIESLPKSVLFMRSFSHWIGGMGIIVLSVAILPELAVGGMQLFTAESSGIEADKLAPRIAATARRLWVLYFAITAVQTIMLLLGNMSLFDAINHSMATIATGGFSTKNASIGGFNSLYVEMVVLVFMFISGLSFTLQYRAILGGQPRRLLQSPEAKLYTLITVASIFLLTVNLYGAGVFDSPLRALRESSFHVVSIITTTGFTLGADSHDFDNWTHFARLLFIGLMLVGGCAGSTAGGSKVIRLYVVLKHAVIQMRKLVRPRLVETLHIGEREIARSATEGVLGYYLLYIVAIMVGGLALTGLGMDLVSAISASVSAMNSIGPGLNEVGAAENFAAVPALGKYVLSFQMLLGRLEIYTVLVLFTAHFWRRG